MTPKTANERKRPAPGLCRAGPNAPSSLGTGAADWRALIVKSIRRDWKRSASRGRTPSAYDSWFAFEAGNLAVNLLRNGIGNQVIGIKDGRVYYLPIIEALKQKREFNLSLYNMINSL